jgi:hypothetical protein
MAEGVAASCRNANCTCPPRLIHAKGGAPDANLTLTDALVPHPLRSSAGRCGVGNPDRLARSGLGTIAKATWRRLHQIGQDDHCPDRLLHGGAWHRIHVGFEKTGARRRQDIALLRGGFESCAGHRPGRRQLAPARCGLQYRPEDARPGNRPKLRASSPRAKDRRFSAQRHPE